MPGPLPDCIRPGVRVLFVGINPGIRSAQVGHHFAGHSNRFWKLLYDARLIPEPIGAEEDGRLPEWGYGITNLVARATPGISDLTKDDYRNGRAALVRRIRRYRPEIVALVGVTLFRALFPETGRTGVVTPGPRSEQLGRVPVFVLPNPSGRNANFTYDEMLRAFRKLRALTPSSRTR
jgi:double-stranded uracil-DNA glycosylase